MTLDPHQKRAVEKSLTSRVSIVTGCPGTGKTFTISSIIDAHTKNCNLQLSDISVCAPTGKAARRVSEDIPIEAATIHRLLGWNPRTNIWSYNKENKLPSRLVICDETSMVDLPLMARLCEAMRPDSTLVLVGDFDQLPPVGPGNIFRDIVLSHKFPTTWLKENHRQGEGSGITFNAIERIRKGAFIHQREDFIWIHSTKVDLIRNKILEIFDGETDLIDGYDPIRDVQLLSPMKKTPIGVHNLNEEVQPILNPIKSNQPVFVWGKKEFRQGDKVIQTKNDYETGIMNGYIGFVEKVSRDGKKMLVQFNGEPEPIEYRTDQEKRVKNLQLAFCITIHKSQGSEFPVVIVPIHDRFYVMLQRNLIYTAVTRAKKRVILIGSKSAINRAIWNTRAERRQTILGNLLEV